MLRRFKDAIRGIRLTLSENNFRIHLIAGLLVTSFIQMYPVTRTHQAILIACIGFVLMAEVFNTSIERISDRITLQQDEKIRNIKDIAAGAVLISAITALIIAVVIITPYIR